MPILYDQANYTKVMVEGEAAKRAIATNMANQNQISNVTVGTNKSLNIKQQEGTKSSTSGKEVEIVLLKIIK